MIRAKNASKNVSWELQKAIAIQIMTSAMTTLNKGIVDAAKFAATTTGFSHEVIRRWAFGYFTVISEYPGSVDNLDLQFTQTELSSERGKTVAMLTPSFMARTFNCVDVNTFIQMRTVKVSPISLLRCFVDGSTTTMG